MKGTVKPTLCVRRFKDIIKDSTRVRSGELDKIS